MLSSELSRELSRLISLMDDYVLILTVPNLNCDGQHLLRVGCKSLAEWCGLERLLQVVVKIVILHLLPGKVALVIRAPSWR